MRIDLRKGTRCSMFTPNFHFWEDFYTGEKPSKELGLAIYMIVLMK